MRILFLENHPMWIHGLPNGFRSIGHKVMISGPLTKQNIPQIISKFKPELIISMGWTSENTGQKPNWIRKYVKYNKIPLVYWATEDPTHTYSFTLPLINKLRPNFVFTICKDRVNYYKALGMKAAHLDFGFSPKVNHSVIPNDKYKCSIAVVANAYPHILKLYPNHYRIKSIETLISPLIKENIRIDFWGKEWEIANEIVGQSIPKKWIHGYLEYTETSQVYSSASIIIGIQNHLTQLTQRTYEILGAKGFLVTSDTPEIRRFFTPDKDLIVSSSPEENLKLVRYYLKNEEEREKIRIRGEMKVKSHSYANRAKYMLKVLHEQKII